MRSARRLLTTCAVALCAVTVIPGAAHATLDGSVAKHTPTVADSGRSPHIFAGTPLTSSAQAPWAVLLQRAGANGFQTYCSANIVSPTVVLTAAHCAVDDGVPAPAAQYRIQAGGTAENQPGTQVIGVAAIAVHPYYRGFESGADVAVMALASPLAFNPNVGAVGIAAPKSYVKKGKKLSFFGWGVTETGAPAGLRGMTTTGRSAAICAAGIPGVLCAFNPKASPCGGDSGGGLIRTTKAGLPELVGLDSYGATECRTGQADGFADLTQPENNAFVGATLAGQPSTPPRGPRARRTPRVQRVSAFSARLRCTTARWANKPKVRTEWAYVSNRKVIQSGKRTTYTIRNRDKGKGIYCTSTAGNAGGRAAVDSSTFFRVFK